MLFFTIIIISVALQIISNIIYKNHLKSIISNLNSSHVVVKLPGVYIIIGTIGIVVCMTFFLLSYYISPDTSDLWVRIFFILFMLLGVLIVLAALRWRIDIYRDEDCFEIRNLLKKKHIKYTDINRVEIKNNLIIVYLEKDKIHIDPFAVNVEYFLAAIREKAKKNID